MARKPQEMGLEERTIQDEFAPRCAVCDAPLTEQEIHTAREAGPPFLCSQHIADVLPAQETEAPDEPPEAGSGGPPTADRRVTSLHACRASPPRR